ncbi:YeeE/YedE family protein [Alteromonas macleodii]|uniref:YeeE/YedE family protein n=1 Tax=Alteromonas macleodii TaxID=28108 RepID=UPI00193098DD|nr:YeeE/YedE family protein [Alteromonas macleodii]MEC8377676.1 YeeE/YedE family protein [Pseudomonadota bacterium]|tara:strand:+ start:779 stop:1204 length:426 start_codon:yes stop_codon:yes gene_type:complete
MRAIIASLICGLLFGFGLIVSGMSNPARVLNFLDFSANWDATLAFVMGGAILVAAPGMFWVRKRSKPLFANKFDIPTSKTIDAKLILGSAAFGIGWGISGFCLGPAVVAIASLQTDVLLFVGAMIVGMLAQHWLNANKANK